MASTKVEAKPGSSTSPKLGVAAAAAVVAVLAALCSLAKAMMPVAGVCPAGAPAAAATGAPTLATSGVVGGSMTSVPGSGDQPVSGRFDRRSTSIEPVT